jgi:hypothetical protein
MDMQSMPTVPFGKHKGKPVTDLLNDVPYLEWCKQQEWFKKHQIIYNICVNQTITNGNQNSKTPEHNKLQNMFLEKIFIQEIIKKYGIEIASALRRYRNAEFLLACPYNIEFEAKFNWDCKIIFDVPERRDIHFYVEIKPLLGDDYPCVLRKMKNQIELTQNFNKYKDDDIGFDRGYKCDMVWLLFIKEYDSTFTPKDKLIQIFDQSGIKVVFLNRLICNLTEHTDSIQNTEQIDKQITEQTTEQNVEQNVEQITEQNIEQNIEQITEQTTEQNIEQTTEQNIGRTRGMDIREFFGKSNIKRNTEQKIEKTDTPKLKEENQILKEKLLHAEDKIRQLEKEIELLKLNSNSM